MKIIYEICCLMLLISLSSCVVNKTFPDKFLFGVATAAYQIEGGWDADGKGENVWDSYLHLHPDAVLNNDNGDVACDSYHKFMEDIEMLKNLNVNFYRFSLSWSRILPTGSVNQINQAGVDYYKNLIKALRDNFIEPYVTLYHWDLPQPLQELGGWPNPILADYFADFARLAFSLFGDDVKHWMTFNEPKQPCQLGHGYGSFPPGYHTNGIGDYLCAHTIIKAHAKAYRIYDEEFRPSQSGKVSFVVDSHWFEPASDDPKDIEAAERRRQFNFGWFANPIYHPDGNYPQVMIDRVAERSAKEGFARSRLPEFTPEEVEYIKGTFDFFALNTYTTNMAQWSDDYEIGAPSWDADVSVTTFVDPSWNATDTDWLYVVPWGTRKFLKWIDETYNHPEIVITENGVSDTGGVDGGRINYYTEYLSAILEAIYEDGVNITGYTAWSLMDNFEWTSGYSQKFGLYQVDFDSPERTRTAKESAGFYRKIIETKCLVDVCE